jgi:D-tyrosyl-tRNA(Tyr) deacylase
VCDREYSNSLDTEVVTPKVQITYDIGIRRDSAILAAQNRLSPVVASQAAVHPQNSMRAVLQRVSSASVAIDGALSASIGPGILVLLGVQIGDTEADATWLAQKIAVLRIFEDDAGKMNRSIVETSGDVLVVSQFTLIASTRKGTRPSFNNAAKPDLAVPLYELFVREIRAVVGRPVPTGTFGALMEVSLVNDGPVTLMIDSRLRE